MFSIFLLGISHGLYFPLGISHVLYFPNRYISCSLFSYSVYLMVSIFLLSISHVLYFPTRYISCSLFSYSIYLMFSIFLLGISHVLYFPTSLPCTFPEEKLETLFSYLKNNLWRSGVMIDVPIPCRIILHLFIYSSSQLWTLTYV